MPWKHQKKHYSFGDYTIPVDVALRRLRYIQWSVTRILERLGDFLPWGYGV
jgi:hypothetical protein